MLGWLYVVVVKKLFSFFFIICKPELTFFFFFFLLLFLLFLLFFLLQTQHRSTGNLLHVDLSVAFGKGLYGLRVPEIVPFRMSRMMLGPLGLGRLMNVKPTCIKTLKCFRENNETIVELLRDTGASNIKWRRCSTSGSTQQSGHNGIVSMGRADEVARRINGRMKYEDVVDSSSVVDSMIETTVMDGIEDVKDVDVVSQVDYLLDVASKGNNLSQMFEGWASWV